MTLVNSDYSTYSLTKNIFQYFLNSILTLDGSVSPEQEALYETLLCLLCASLSSFSLIII